MACCAGAQAVDGSDSQCATVTATNTSTGAWLTVDLGYRGQLAAIGVDLGSNDVTELSLRVGNRRVTTGDTHRPPPTPASSPAPPPPLPFLRRCDRSHGLISCARHASRKVMTQHESLVAGLSLGVLTHQGCKWRAGTENDFCQPSVSNLPGYSKTLFGCTLTGRYVTVLATNAAMTLDLCLLTVFLQDAPINGSALSPTSGVRPAASKVFFFLRATIHYQGLCATVSCYLQSPRARERRGGGGSCVTCAADRMLRGA